VHSRGFGIKVVKKPPSQKKLNRTGELKLYEQEVLNRRKTLTQFTQQGMLAMTPQTAEHLLADFEQLPLLDVAAELTVLRQSPYSALPACNGN
jgi:hypothetical protein